MIKTILAVFFGGFCALAQTATPTIPLQLLPPIPYAQVTGTPTIPANVSQLVNDSGFITASAIPAVPTKLSQFINDVGYYGASTPIPFAQLTGVPTYATAANLTALQATVSTLQAQLSAAQAAITALQNAQAPTTSTSTGGSTTGATAPPPPPMYTAAAKLTPSAQTAAVGQSVTVTADHPVSWKLVPGSLGTLSNPTPTSVTYTAPASAPQPQNSVAGCPVSPYDSIYNTRIDNLPVNPNSATWINVTTNPISLNADFGLNVVDNTLPATPQTFHYTTSYTAPFQITPPPSRFRESGSLTTDNGINDHHLISVNHQNCQFFETYQDGNSGPNTAQSGYSYSGNSYAMPTGGTTDAAGLPLDPLTLHLSDIRSGAINHAMRFTLCTGCISSQAFLWPATGANGSNIPTTQAPPMGTRFRLKRGWDPTGIMSVSLKAGGTGYTTAPTVTVSGCTVAPTVTAAVNASGAVSSLTRVTTGSGCKSPAIAFGGPGTGAAASANTITMPPTATDKMVFTALQLYGMILADNGGSGQIQMDADVTQDHGVFYDLSHIAWDNISISQNFEAVDESGLMLNSGSTAVDATNQLQQPAAFAQVLATDVSSNVAKLPIAVQPVTVGVQYQTISFVAGAPAFTIPAWVNGTSNQGINWTLTSGPGSLTAAGVYTPPATVAALTPVAFAGTSAQDPTATVIVKGNVLPVSADGSIRIDSGNFGNAYTDKTGIAWQPDLVAQENVSNNPVNDGYPLNLWSSPTVPDPFLYQYSASSQGADVVYGPFVVPNGNYKVTFSSGIPNCSTTWTPGTWDGDLTWGPVALESQGAIQGSFDVTTATNNACRVPVFGSIPASVTNNVLTFAFRGTTYTRNGATVHSVPLVLTLQIAPVPVTPPATTTSTPTN